MKRTVWPWALAVGAVVAGLLAGKRLAGGAGPTGLTDLELAVLLLKADARDPGALAQLVALNLKFPVGSGAHEQVDAVLSKLDALALAEQAASRSGEFGTK